MTKEQAFVLLSLVYFVSFLLTGVLFVLFGQVTVRRLRKNPATSRYLGFEFFPGWDIINAAAALSWSRRLKWRLDQGPLSDFHANTEVLYRHTSAGDRLLARVFYGTLLFSCLWLAIIGVARKLWW
jgi:hypothetical protein